MYLSKQARLCGNVNIENTACLYKTRHLLITTLREFNLLLEFCFQRKLKGFAQAGQFQKISCFGFL
jgi:hypothetical protein